MNIILRESDAHAKFDMFERLNTGGSNLSEQEVRNCLLIMANKPFFETVQEMGSNEDFLNAISITDKARELRYELELVLRFILLVDFDVDKFRQYPDVGIYLTEASLELAESDTDVNKINEIKESFFKTFQYLNEAVGADAFRRFDPAKGRHLGGFAVSAFEAVGIGLGPNIENWGNSDENHSTLRQRVSDIWSNEDFTGKQGSGVRGTDRIPSTIPFGQGFFERP